MLWRRVCIGFALFLLSSSANASLNGWYTCSELTFADEINKTAASSSNSNSQSFLTGAECALFTAPLCYDGVCPSTSSAGNTTEIKVFVKRIQATQDPATKPNLWILQGGPGAGSTNMESAMQDLHEMLDGQVNVYTMDHRGTGRSTLLNCLTTQAQTSGSPSGSTVSVTEVAACADELQAEFGKGNLAGFSITSAAWDLRNFITTYQANVPTFVYGVSYGSSVVERLMHLNVSSIAGYILDGVSTTSGSAESHFEYFSTWDVDYNEVGATFLAACAQSNDDCAKYFSTTSLPNTLTKLISQLDSGTATCSTALYSIFSNVVGASSDEIGQYARILLGRLLSDAKLRTFLPSIVYRMNRCNTDDKLILNHFFSTLVTLLNSSPEDDFFSSNLLYKLIVYSELWEVPTPSMTELAERFTQTTLSSGMMSMLSGYCVFTKDTSTTCSSYSSYADYSANAIMYERDEYWNVAANVPSNQSVLLLSSKMDPQTPHKFAEYLYASLNAEHKQLVAFDHATHGQMWRTPIVGSNRTCGMTIVASYVANGGDLSKLDQSCLSKVEPLNLLPSSQLVSRLFNATDAFNGEYTTSSSSSQQTESSGSSTSGSWYKMGVIVLIIVGIAVAVVGVTFFLKWRNIDLHATEMAVMGTPVATTP